MPKAKQIKLYSQKLEGKPFEFDYHNQKMFDTFQEQAAPGCYQVSYKKDIPPKTLDQLGYWYGGIIGEADSNKYNGMVAQLLERGDDVLYEIKVGNETIPIMTNKENCDFLLKSHYMVSIGKAGQKFSKGNSNIDEMSKLIDWALDYLPKYWGVYVMSSEEYKRMIGLRSK